MVSVRWEKVVNRKDRDCRRPNTIFCLLRTGEPDFWRMREKKLLKHRGG